MEAGNLKRFTNAINLSVRMADRTIGGTDPKSGRGYIGIEASFDKELEGKSGIGWVRMVEGGMKIPVGDALNVQPEAGRDIYTTLDMNYQDMAEIALRKKLIEMEANLDQWLSWRWQPAKSGPWPILQNGAKENTRRILITHWQEATIQDPLSSLLTMMALLEETKMNPDQVTVNTGNGIHADFGTIYIDDAQRGGFGRLRLRRYWKNPPILAIVYADADVFRH